MKLTSIRPSEQRAQHTSHPQPALALSLSRDELHQLSECEEVIKRGLHTFIQVGLALEVVRAKKLYREKFGTFEEYCRVRWDMTARRARQICSASQVVTNLLGPDTNSTNPKNGTIVPKSEIINPKSEIPLPTTESQARPLAALSPPAQRKVWQAAVAAAPEGKVTAAIVQKQVDARNRAEKRRRGWEFRREKIEEPKKPAKPQPKKPVKAKANTEEFVYTIRCWPEAKRWHVTISEGTTILREGAYRSRYEAALDTSRELEKLIKL